MSSYIPTLTPTLDSYNELPSRLEMAIALFTKTATSDGFGSVHARSVRIPTIENVTIDALAEYSGLSANKVICQLLEVALDEVFQGMTEQQRGDVFKIRSKHLGKVVDKDGFPILEGEEQSGAGEI